MKSIKTSSLLAAVSAFAVLAGFAAQPASANDWGRVDWHFTNRDIDLTIAPDDFTLAAVSAVVADQLFVGTEVSSATALDISTGAANNAASSVANVISVTGDSSVNNGKSPFVAVVDAVQHAYGSLSANAAINGATVIGSTGDIKNGLSSTATAAANVVSLDASKLALVSLEQGVGSAVTPITLNSTATASNVTMPSGGAFANTASSVGNVVSVNVAPAAASQPTLSHDNRFVPPLPGLTSLALVDVHQATFANMTSLASAGGVNTGGGAFTNSATAAANVVSIINKK